MNVGKRTFLVFCMCWLCLGCLGNASKSEGRRGKNWQLGIQTYTFKEFTFYEAVDKAAQLGLDYVEPYIFSPSACQRLSEEKPDVRFHYTMLPEAKEEVKRKLAQSGVKLLSCYVVKLPDNEAECRKIFDFVKDIGAETIVSEPSTEILDMAEKLCKEYQIKLAIHNHPSSSPWHRYWHPDKVLAACRGRSSWIGACVDTGHWVRSGVNPVEGLKKLEGRVICLHLKDLNKFGDPNAHDVVWGQGVSNIKAILVELNRQNFRGSFSIEYEYYWENPTPEVADCVKYFDEVANELNRGRQKQFQK